MNLKKRLGRLFQQSSQVISENWDPPRDKNFNVIGKTKSEYQSNLAQNRRANLRMLQVAYSYFCAGNALVSSHNPVSVFDFGCAFSPIGQVYALDPVVEPAIERYLGVDIDANAIEWNSRISDQNKHFIYRHYNPEHERYFDDPKVIDASNLDKAADFLGLKLVLESDSIFDIQLSSSVFTHLYIKEFEAFLRMVSPYMRSGGILFNSLFLLDYSLDLKRKGKSVYSKPDRQFEPCISGELAEGSFTYAPHNPRAGIAFSRETVIEMVTRIPGLIIEDFLYGDWRGIQRVPVSPNYQDWLILRKE